MNIFEKLSDEKIIPVIKLNNSESAVPLARALIAGGINVAEITFRTDAAVDSIQKIIGQFPHMLVGAGTVLTVDNAKMAIDSGVSFVVAPGFNPRIVEYCQSRNISIIPGVNSPSQVEQAMEMELRVLKFFPAEISGGIAMLKALGAVYNVSFIPTGGLNEENFINYLSLPNVMACGGSWMVKADLIGPGKFDEITKLSLGIRKQLITVFG